MKSIFRSIGARLTIFVGFALIVVNAVSIILSIRYLGNVLAEEALRNATRYCDTVMRSTREAMLRNRREDVATIIQSVASQEGVEAVFIMDKGGKVGYAAGGLQVGTVVEKTSSFCVRCHQGADYREKPSAQRCATVLSADDGHRTLAVVDLIMNEPACWSADCHAHSEQDTVLGIMETRLSLAENDRRQNLMTGTLLLFGGVLTLIMCSVTALLIRQVVTKPVGKLLTGTRRVAEGDLDYETGYKSQDELGDLVQSFNKMTHKLKENIEKHAGTQQQLFHLEKLGCLGKLAAGVAHEINNPLTTILNYGSLLLTDAKQAARPEAEDLEVIVSETRRCKAIVKDLLDFSRTSAPVKIPGNVNLLIAETLLLIRYQPGFQNMELVTLSDGELPQLTFDSSQMKQVLLDMLINASQAMPSGGKITITTRWSSDRKHVEIEIADTGCGIAQANLHKIFQPFFTTKDAGSGYGLGLAICYEIVQRHGGNIAVSSQEGVGTVFVIKLPTAPPPEA